MGMGACFREMARFTLFGSMWWKGKQISNVPKAKVSIDSDTLKANVSTLTSKFGLQLNTAISDIRPLEIFPRSIGAEMFLQLSPDGVMFVRPIRERKSLKEKFRGTAPLISAVTRQFNTYWTGSD